MLNEDHVQTLKPVTRATRATENNKIYDVLLRSVSFKQNVYSIRYFTGFSPKFVVNQLPWLVFFTRESLCAFKFPQWMEIHRAWEMVIVVVVAMFYPIWISLFARPLNAREEASENRK